MFLLAEHRPLGVNHLNKVRLMSRDRLSFIERSDGAALEPRGIMITSRIKFGIHGLVLALLLTATAAVAAPRVKNSQANAIPPFPGTLVNAKYVYVTSYDGDQFDINLFPEDAKAIAAVQNAIQSWGKFVVVYKPSQADIVLMVTSRPSEDVLAVYDAHGWPQSDEFLWRMMGRNGLQTGETPLVTNLEKAFAAATATK
jgi:hypothetical protein